MAIDTAVHVSSRVDGFDYAIRNVVAEAKRVEAGGRTVRYLNIGDPVQFGFQPPPRLVEAVERAMRDGHNGYVPSAGIGQARDAVAAEYTERGMPVEPDRIVITEGTSEGIELALSALVDPGDEVLLPVPTYPLYTAVATKIGARAVFYPTDPAQGWSPDVDRLRDLVTGRTRVLVLIDPNNPTGSVYSESTRRQLLDLADRAGLTILADEVYGDLAFDGPTPRLGALAPDAAIISFSSLSKAWLAPGWRTGWLVVGRTPRLDGVLAGIQKMADGRLCSSGPMQYAVAPALGGDRGHQREFVRALRERADRTVARLTGVDGLRITAPRAAFYAMPQVDLPPGVTDRDFTLALLREAGLLTVHGSGFGLPADAGFLRLVFLAPPDELDGIYDTLTAFVARFRARSRPPARV